MASNEAAHASIHAGAEEPLSATANHEAGEAATLPPSQIQQQTDELPSSTPLEMSHLTSDPRHTSPQAASSAQHLDGSSTSTDPRFPESTQTTSNSQLLPPGDTRPTRPRQVSEAIGPSTEETPTATLIQQQSNSGPDSGPAVLITLILLSGARHPYKVDLKYLRKRNVAKEGEEIDPFEISVYTLKELIWRDWRDEWDPRPTIPGSIRLIHFGKLLDEKQTLKDCRFQPSVPNVVHMTVRPQEVVDEEENAKVGKRSSSRRTRADDGDGRDGRGGGGCCGCVIL